MSRVRVVSLNSFTSYQFRLVLETSNEPLSISLPSYPVVTKAEGPPGSPPKLLAARQLRNLNINVTFQPPDFPNGPITSYNLYIQERSGGDRRKAFSVVKDISATASSYV